MGKIFFSKRGALVALLLLVAVHGLLRNVGAAQEEGVIMKDQQKNQNVTGQCGLPLNDEELKKILTPEQFKVLRQNGTELPFANVHWNNKRAGIYVDPITGEPLFSSSEKFDSGTGWPSFTAPLNKEVVVEKEDKSQGMSRIEVRAKKSNSHLGHVFPDGPKPTGLRYCINSAALRFIPVEDLEKEGYVEYLALFGKGKEGMEPVKKTQIATFGAGCFWGVQSAFDGLKGVIKTRVGYMGGSLKNPTYRDVCTDTTGHAEVVQVEYDPASISYQQLLEVFWQIHDPTTLNRQGPDIGPQYRSVIFFYSPEQETIAKQAIQALVKSQVHKGKIVTEVTQAKEFYPAEEYHQKYFEKQGKNPSCHIPAR